MMKLYIANKKYSSWSFRPWLALTQKAIPFEEVLVPFDMVNGNPAFKKFSPNSKVPILVDGETTVWESLAIMEYVAEKYPDRGLWPEHPVARAKARSIACEMLSGFTALRGAFPMHMAREPKAYPVNDDVQKDLNRITKIWGQCLADHGGPFLFGDFTIVDAMFAPVANRIHIYELSDDSITQQYSSTIRAMPAYQAWQEAGKAETWYVAEDEID